MFEMISQESNRQAREIMGVRQFFLELRRHLSFERRSPTPCDRIAAILVQLQGKEADLAVQLEKEDRPARRRRLEIEMEVVRLHQAKGLARQLELRDACR